MKKRFFLSVLAHSFLCPIAQACDAYQRTMESIEYWNSYNFSDGFTKAIDKWYAPEGKITMGLLTTSPKAFFDEFPLDITKLSYARCQKCQQHVAVELTPPEYILFVLVMS